LNDTRVFPARLRGRRGTAGMKDGGAGGAKVEILLLAPVPGDTLRWTALVKPARAGRRGEIDLLGATGARARGIREEEAGRFVVEIERDGKILDPERVFALCEAAGETPLPPYIERKPGDPRRDLDRERYQTVYARVPGSAAAPTAGLHFSGELLGRLRGQGIETASVTLAVGLGTFQPLREDALRSGRLHREAVSIGEGDAARIIAARGEGRRIVAVGTTSARALESWALAGTPPSAPRGEGAGADRTAWAAETDLLIAPGFRFALVDAMVTNFHLPRSSLLLLVAAFAGRERILDAYRRAVEEGFRFYSYGDAMLIL
jgi:S-adenosylmethionine:tRNA ribosyltransferase-isomerase